MSEHEDRQAIVDLTIAYAWALDMREFELLRNIFLPEATALLVDERIGVDSIIERVQIGRAHV